MDINSWTTRARFKADERVNGGWSGKGGVGVGQEDEADEAYHFQSIIVDELLEAMLWTLVPVVDRFSKEGDDVEAGTDFRMYCIDAVIGNISSSRGADRRMDVEAETVLLLVAVVMWLTGSPFFPDCASLLLRSFTNDPVRGTTFGIDRMDTAVDVPSSSSSSSKSSSSSPSLISIGWSSVAVELLLLDHKEGAVVELDKSTNELVFVMFLFRDRWSDRSVKFLATAVIRFGMVLV